MYESDRKNKIRRCSSFSASGPTRVSSWWPPSDDLRCPHGLLCFLPSRSRRPSPTCCSSSSISTTMRGQNKREPRRPLHGDPILKSSLHLHVQVHCLAGLRLLHGRLAPLLEPPRPTTAQGGGVRCVHQSNPMASGWPSFVAAVSSDTCVTACVATTAICVTACSVTGLMRTVTPGALLPLRDAARALPGLISCCSDELLYIAEVSYLTAPERGCSSQAGPQFVPPSLSLSYIITVAVLLIDFL
ncbi:hypothetical protein VPH35_035539 [Triticum aestivum]